MTIKIIEITKTEEQKPKLLKYNVVRVPPLRIVSKRTKVVRSVKNFARFENAFDLIESNMISPITIARVNEPTIIKTNDGTTLVLL